MSDTVRIAALGLMLSTVALAGCMGTPGVTRGPLAGLPGSTDAERAIIGAVGGALVADALDTSVLGGAAVGAGAGALCDDAGVCVPLD